MKAGITSHSQSLGKQIDTLEEQLMLHRRRLQTLATGINRKIANHMISPAMLLGAVGIGAAIEQTSHYRGWSLATVLDATSACFRLLLSFSSSMSPACHPGNTNSCSNASGQAHWAKTHDDPGRP